MIHWRHEEDKRKRKRSHNDSSRSTSSEDGTTRGQFLPIPTRTRTHPSESTQGARWSASTDLDCEGQSYAFANTGQDSFGFEVDSRGSHDAGSSRWQLRATETAVYFPRYRNRTWSTVGQPVTEYEESERHEERQLRTLVVGLASFYNVGGTHDPFDVLPQFQNPRLNALFLSRTCKSRAGVATRLRF
jgi:hypothetical protein